MLRKKLSAIPGPKLVPLLGLTWHLAIIPREGKFEKNKLKKKTIELSHTLLIFKMFETRNLDFPRNKVIICQNFVA